jgi:hypothetical protein
MLAECAQLALEDEEIVDNICIFTATAISYSHEDGIDNPKNPKTGTESPLTDTCDTSIIEELHAIGQYPFFRDFVEFLEGRKASRNHLVYMIKHNQAGKMQWIRIRLCGR